MSQDKKGPWDCSPGETPSAAGRFAWLGKYALAIAFLAALAGGAVLIYAEIDEHCSGPDLLSSAELSEAPQAGAASARAPQMFVKTSAMLYIKSLTDKKYGWIARALGKQDCIEDRTVYDPRKSWWENPSIVYQETPIESPDVRAGVDGVEIRGTGSSSNVEVSVSLTSHAAVALKTIPRSDCMKGTVTVTLTASSHYYDDDWTPIFDVKDKTLVFAFDTRDPSRPVRVTGTDSRTIQVFFECYRRDKERWSPKSEWPGEPERADMQSVFYSRDAKLEVTGYRYDDEPATASRR